MSPSFRPLDTSSILKPRSNVAKKGRVCSDMRLYESPLSINNGPFNFLFSFKIQKYLKIAHNEAKIKVGGSLSRILGNYRKVGVKSTLIIRNLDL